MGVIQKHRRHAQKRALNRYDLRLSKDDVLSLESLIHSGHRTFLWDENVVGDKRATYFVPWDGDAIICVYSHVRNCLITVLPHDAKIKTKKQE